MPPSISPRPGEVSSVDAAEIERFDSHAGGWWDETGPFAPLHRFTPVRMDYIRRSLCAHFDRDRESTRPLEGLRILDIGCGGGLLSEPLARLGAGVVGADAGKKNIAAAQAHAVAGGLEIDYRVTTAEALSAAAERFDVIVNMEVVEHVPDPAAFIACCAGMVAEGGVMFVATLNRTLRSFFLAIVGAEYVLRWLPRGTHDWRKFVPPETLTTACKSAGLDIADVRGVVFNPLSGRWSLSPDTAVNYMVRAVRGGAAKRS